MKSAPLIASRVVDSACRRIRNERILNVQEELSPPCGSISDWIEVSDTRMHPTRPDHKLTALGWSLSLSNNGVSHGR